MNLITVIQEGSILQLFYTYNYAFYFMEIDPVATACATG